MILTNKITIGAKLEATPYTAETLAQADYNFRAGDVSYSHEINEYKRKYASGILSNEQSVMGKQFGTVSFYVDLAFNSAPGTTTPWGKLLQACGALETDHTTTGTSWKPESDYTQKPITIEIVEKEEGTSPGQVVIKLAGCMGNCKIVLNQVGEPCRLEFEFKGRLESITERDFSSIITPSFTALALPARVLSSTIEIAGEAQDCDKMTLDFGNDLQPITDPSNATGIKGFQIVGREPTLTIDPYMRSLAESLYSDWKDSVPGSFSMEIGANGTLSAPSAQLITLNPGERAGARTHEKKFLLLGSIGDDEWKLVQGSES